MKHSFVLAAVLMAVLFGSVASAADVPAPQLFSAPTQPVAGKRFAGLALVLPPQAQTAWTSFRATCLAWAAGRRLRATVTASPQGAAIPGAVVCSWVIPARTAGKQLRARIATNLTWNDGSLEHDEGQLVKWTIQRR